MFQPATFQPMKGLGFLPPVNMTGQGTRQVQMRRAQAFYPTVNLGQPLPAQEGFLPQVSLGQDLQTAQAWYERAKKAIARFEFLSSRVGAIANKTERENIITWLGSASVPGTPQYRYATVKSDFTSDVAREGVGAYNVERRQNRVAELEDFNDEFNTKVEAAIRTYGELPTPQQPQQPQQPTQMPDLTVPILVGAGAIALALIL